jgi:hypothetical protein
LRSVVLRVIESVAPKNIADFCRLTQWGLQDDTVRSQCGASRFYLMLHAASYVERRMQPTTAPCDLTQAINSAGLCFTPEPCRLSDWIATRSHAISARNYDHHWRFDVMRTCPT